MLSFILSPIQRRIAARRARWQEWMRARHGAGDITKLTHRNVYIVPTSTSLLFGFTLLLLLITAINYQLNLGYLFTFLLGGAALLAAPMTQRNLRGLQLELRPQDEAFAQEPIELRVVVSADRQPHWGLNLRFQHSKTAPEWINLAPGARETVSLSHTFEQRGWNRWPQVRLQTTFPLGVFVSWTYWQPGRSILVYPAPEPNAPPLPDLSATQEQMQDRPVQAIPTGEFDEVRAYQPGDSQRRIIWKRLAQNDQLIARTEGKSSGADLWLDWHTLPGLDEEQRLSRLTAWVLRAEAQSRRYGLRLPHEERPPDSGHTHRQACLRLLALHGLMQEPEAAQASGMQASQASKPLDTTPPPSLRPAR